MPNGFMMQGSAAAPLDPRLGPLQGHGGPTPTMALHPGSPAIDLGRGSGLTTDQQGRPCPFDWPAVVNANIFEGAVGVECLQLA